MKPTHLLIVAGLASALGIAVVSTAFAEESSQKREKARQRMQAIDADGSGTISRNEFLAQAGKRFDKIDMDGNGELSREEMAALRGQLKPSGSNRGDDTGKRFP